MLADFSFRARALNPRLALKCSKSPWIVFYLAREPINRPSDAD